MFIYQIIKADKPAAGILVVPTPESIFLVYSGDLNKKKKEELNDYKEQIED